MAQAFAAQLALGAAELPALTAEARSHLSLVVAANWANYWAA
jgi:hypothetical protein